MCHRLGPTIQFFLCHTCSMFTASSWTSLRDTVQQYGEYKALSFMSLLACDLCLPPVSVFSTVRACLDLLLPWLHLYIDSQDSSSHSFCDVTLHGPFYATCQAVFYTLVFRHRAIVEGNMKKGKAGESSFLNCGVGSSVIVWVRILAATWQL